MSMEDILEKLNIIFDNTRFTKESLKQPKNLQDIYTLFLMEYNISYRFIPSEGTPLFKPNILDVHSGILHLFSKIGFDSEELSFELNDLISPVLSRTTKFLWSLCNYFMHSNNIFQHENLIQNCIEDSKDEFSSVESQIKLYRQYIQEKHMSRGIEKLEIDTLTKEIKEKDEVLQKLTEEVNEVTKRTEPILNELKEEVAQTEERTKRINDLKFLQNINLAKSKNDELKESLSKKNSYRTLLNGSLRTMEDKLSAFEIHLLKQLLEIKREFKRTQHENKQNQVAIKEESWKLEDVLSEIGKKKQKSEENSAELKNLELKWSKKKHLKMMEIEDYSKMTDSQTQKKVEYESISKDLQKQIELLKAEISSFNQEWKDLNRSCSNEYSTIIQTVRSFTEHFNFESNNDIKKL